MGRKIKPKYFIIFGVIFLISLTSAQQYEEVKLNSYEVLSQTNIEQVYDVRFSEPNESGMIQISACVDNETKIIENLEVDKECQNKVYLNYIRLRLL